MNPQQNDDAATLKARLSQLPPARPPTQVNVPARPQTPAGPLEDIDDSAFAIGGETPKYVAAPPGAATMPTPAPLPPVQQARPTPARQPMDVVPPRPAPAPTPPVPIPPVLPPAPIMQPAPAPVIAPQPVPRPPTIAQPVTPPTPRPAPVQALPPLPAPAPVPVPQPRPAPPVPMAVVAPARPVAAAAPASTVAYQPPTQHIASDLVERIDEKPQQNSSDIEHLIQHSHRLHRLKGLASFLVFLAGVVFAAFLLNQFVFQSYYVDGTSMTPTLQNDDRLIIDKIGHTWSGLQGKPYIPTRGQIVVLDSSIVGVNGREEQLIKRVIGLPGDTVIIKDGVVTVRNKDNPDGFSVDEQLGLKVQPTFTDAPLEVTIPENEVFVMGDNRVENGSYDSRAFGAIHADKIVGRLWARILPLDKAQTF